MRRSELRYLPGSSRRAGYTLTELAVVIFIIVTLMALSAGAVMKFMAVQQTSNTRITLDRTQTKLNKAWSAVKEQAVTESIPSGIQNQITPALAGNDVNAMARMRVIYVKLRQRQVFPMNFCEALNVPYFNQAMGTAVPPSPVPALPAYVTYLGKLGITPAYLLSLGCNLPTYQPQPYESSACLLMALQRFQSGSGIDMSDLMGGGAAGNTTTPTGGTLPFLTDAWNEPIFFTRMPTGSLFLNPTGAQPGNNDPGDPNGYLNSGTWSTKNPNGQALFVALTQQTFTPLSNVPTSFKLAPMLMSMGPDKNPETNTVTFAPLNAVIGYGDDLFSTP